MVYQVRSLETKIGDLRARINWGVKLIALMLALGLFTTEVHRILSSPSTVTDYLYLALLVVLGLLIGGWYWVSQTELSIISEWLDPIHYSPPEETLTMMAIAVALGVLLFAARRPTLFGVAYAAYTVANLLAWKHLQHQLKLTLASSRKRLNDEGTAVVGTAPIISGAIAEIERYYISKWHTLRLVIVLLLASTGFALSTYGHLRGYGWTDGAAYGIYVFDILVFEEIVMTSWRLRFYSAMRGPKAALDESARPAH
jgi:hypothetical protein